MRRTGPFTARRVYGALIVLVMAAVPVLYINYRLALRPVALGTCTCDAVNFEVAPGENAQSVATALKSAGLIRDRNAFISYINFHGLRPRLKTGTYSFSQKLYASRIAEDIAAGRTLSKRLLVPPGYRISQIETAAAALGISKASFQAALDAPHNESFLATKPPGVDLEGYLFPDSYEVGPQTTATSIVQAMLDDFGTQVGPEYAQAFAAEGLTLHQGLTIASIVEKEVSNPQDRPVVAQIFIKRHKLGMPLGSDVTAVYAADLLGVPFSTSVNSPYNTLLAPGLPPGPICSPSLGALDAVAHPASTDYTYFLSGKDGKTYFANTYAEHQANIAKYLN